MTLSFITKCPNKIVIIFYSGEFMSTSKSDLFKHIQFLKNYKPIASLNASSLDSVS